MLINHIGAHTDMNGEGHIALVCSGDDAGLRVREAHRPASSEALLHLAPEWSIAHEHAQSFTKSEFLILSFSERGINVAEFPGHAKPPRRKSSRHMLARLPDQGKLKIMNRACPVGGDKRHDLPPDQVGHKRTKSVLDHVRANETDHRMIGPDSSPDEFRELCYGGFQATKIVLGPADNFRSYQVFHCYPVRSFRNRVRADPVSRKKRISAVVFHAVCFLRIHGGSFPR
ncbi:hypothetical protein EHM92_06105 [bacterium]|nr:MAG: hypothetical protein EHM92_06105 [bacterium]